MNKQKILRGIFDIGLILKGLHGLVEIISGTILLIVSSSWVVNGILKLFSYELLEDPGDIIANLAVHSLHNLPLKFIHIGGIYLILFGIINVTLCLSALSGKIKGFLFAISILSIMIIYQLWRILLHPSLTLILFTLFDGVILWLVLNEYRRLKEKSSRRHCF